MTPQVQSLPNSELVIQAAANYFVAYAGATLQTGKRFCVSLSGGTTPRALYELLSTPKYQEQVDWSQVDIFWGDERCVPPDHIDSDYGMAKAALLDHLASSANPGIFRLKGEIDPCQAADQYEVLLRNYFGDRPSTSFDLLLLGLGEDAHTASLFPGTAAIHEPLRWVVAHFIPKLSAWRLTLTPPILNLASQTIFLVNGAGKRPALGHLLHGPYQPAEFPAQIIQPVHGRPLILTDQDI